MNKWVQIRCCGTQDPPRYFYATYKGQEFHFHCSWTGDAEVYKVFLRPNASTEERNNLNVFAQRQLPFIGEIPVKEVPFDSTRGKEIDPAVLDSLLYGSQVQKQQ